MKHVGNLDYEHGSFWRFLSILLVLNDCILYINEYFPSKGKIKTLDKVPYFTILTSPITVTLSARGFLNSILHLNKIMLSQRRFRGKRRNIQTCWHGGGRYGKICRKEVKEEEEKEERKWEFWSDRKGRGSTHKKLSLEFYRRSCARSQRHLWRRGKNALYMNQWGCSFFVVSLSVIDTACFPRCPL